MDILEAVGFQEQFFYGRVVYTMIDISKLSKRYSVRILEESDVEMLVEICKQNTVFYEYTEARQTGENILDDIPSRRLHILAFL